MPKINCRKLLTNYCKARMIADTPDKEMEMNTENVPQVEMVGDVPELPTPGGPWHATSDYEGYYTFTADQMRAYAQAALNARAGGDGWLELLEAAKQASATLGHIYHTTPIGGALEQHAHDGYQRLDAATRAIDAALASQAVGVK